MEAQTSLLTTYGELFGVAVTAVATIVLAWFTATLARETRRMAEAGAQPHVVATIDINRWSMLHMDFGVYNTGNAPAYDIQVTADPPFERRQDNALVPVMPLRAISVLRPGTGIASYLSEYSLLKGKQFKVTVSWKKAHSDKRRESNSYVLDLAGLDQMRKLGASDPLVQLAEEVKKLREDWRPVAAGHQRIRADIFSMADRLHEQRQQNRWLRQIQREQQSAETDGTAERS